MSIDCVEFCRTLGDATRQQILELLMDRDLCVGDIVAAFKMSQPTISHHLNILKQFGLVSSHKEGKQVVYSINRERVVRCCGMLISRFNAEESGE
jgi:ArsR family transcriptional regulator, arsenate/arsenite/antimonite-responsive transcriptional repressor